MSGELENIIVLTNYRDIPPAILVTKGLSNFRVITHDPHVVDLAAAQGLGSVELVNWEGCPDFSGIVDEVTAALESAETELAIAARRTHPEVSVQAWQYWSLSHIFMIFIWYRGMWRDLPKNPDATYYVFIYDNVDSLPGWNFLSALMLLEVLTNAGIKFSAYSYGKDAKSLEYKIPDLSKINSTDSKEYLLTHIPTCSYDSVYFNEEILASGKGVINLESALFNVPVLVGQSLSLIDADQTLQSFPHDTQQRILAFVQDIQIVLSGIFGKNIRSVVFAERQVNHIARAFQAQMVFYHSQVNHLTSLKPSKILLSDHDTAIHGPLISYAQLHSIPVVLIPHSKRTNALPYHYDNIVCLHHPMQSAVICNGKGTALLSLAMCYPEVLQGSSTSSRLGSIGILLNELCCCDLGIYYASITPYTEGLAEIARWCDAHGVRLNIRCRPNSPLLALLSEATGLAVDQLDHSRRIALDDFAGGIDLCLMYGSPTSGVINFLQKSKPVIGTVSQPLASVESSTVSADIVPCHGIRETLDLLTSFYSDPAVFLQFRNRQFSRYVAGFSESHPLRKFL
jgi:hypothetical protein